MAAAAEPGATDGLVVDKMYTVETKSEARKPLVDVLGGCDTAKAAS